MHLKKKKRRKRKKVCILLIKRVIEENSLKVLIKKSYQEYNLPVTWILTSGTLTYFWKSSNLKDAACNPGNLISKSHTKWGKSQSWK